MNRTLAAFAAALSIAVVAAPASAAVNARQLNQQRNIDAGLRSGKLTQGEYNRLKDEQRMISRAEHRFQRSGGRYTEAEKQQVHAMQDAAARHMDRLKHNGRRG